MPREALPLRAVLLDLDGTLADTGPDLAYALNTVLEEQGRAPLPYPRIRPVVSHGARALIELGFQRGPGDAGFEPLRQRLLDVYAANLARETTLFPGMAEVLAALEDAGLAWGVVTNKPAFLTEPLMAALGLHTRAACIVSGDTLPQRKPDPAPMHHACALCGVQGPEALYVGDARRDVEAGHAAGMPTLVALFGYLAADDRPEEWGADGLIEHPRGILDWMRRRAPAPSL